MEKRSQTRVKAHKQKMTDLDDNLLEDAEAVNLLNERRYPLGRQVLVALCTHAIEKLGLCHTIECCPRAVDEESHESVKGRVDLAALHQLGNLVGRQLCQ
jgi:hypothetical protein